MIFKWLLDFVAALWTPIVSVLPDMPTSPDQAEALRTALFSVNAVVDLPTILAAFLPMFYLATTVMGPMFALKFWRMIRGGS